MNNRFRILLRHLTMVAIVIGTIATSTSCADFAPLPKPTLATRNTDIATLYALCTAAPVTIESDMVIAGRVTTDDSAGNFRRSLFIEDHSGGAEILVGQYDLHCKYPLGAMLSVKMHGATAFVADGVLQIGLKAESYSYREVDYFYAEAVADKYIGRGDDILVVKPTTLALDALSEVHCSRLLHIDDLQHSPLDGQCADTYAGYHRFIDTHGNELYIYVDEYADFASTQLPIDKVSVTGILHYGNVGNGTGKHLFIKPRSENDIQPYSNHN